MEDTVLPEEPFNYKSLPLRITYKELDYLVCILQKEITKHTRQVRILFDGMVHTLANEGDGWHFQGTDENRDLAKAIWDAISLRYRLR